MSSELQADLDRIASNQFAVVADDARVTRTVAALEANGISVLRAANAGEAKRIVLDPTSRTLADASTNTPSRWRTRVPRRRMACAAA